MTGIESPCLFIRECQQALAALMFLFRRNHIIDLQGLRPRTFGVAEYVQLCHIQSGNKLISLFKILFRLSASTYNHIDSDKGIRHHFLDFLYFRGKKSRIITTAHQFQHFIATGLQRDMKMRHKSTGTGNELDDFISQQIGLDRRNAVTFDAFHLIQRFHQIKESLTGSLTKIADIHACQYDLFSAFGSSLPCLLHHRGNSTVTAASTGKRNGTIRTEIIASVLYFQEETSTVAP